VCHAGLVHVRRAGEVFAIDARSGKIVWTAAPGGLHREAIEVPDDRVQFSGGPPAPEPGLALHAWEDGSGKAVLLGIDGLSAPRAGRDGRTRWTANLLVAYDSRNGKLAWTASGGEDEEEGPLALAGTPVVAAGLVIAAGFQGDGVHVLAFTARGQRVWTRRLYILNQPPQAGWAFGGQAPLLAASGDTLVAGANGGLVCALEASTGELLWLSRYRNTGEEPNARQVSREPPVIAGGAAILSPADSDAVTAFDLASGAIRWERRQEASRQVLIGADGERAFVAGRKVAALRLADGETAWESEAVGPFAGSAVCAGGRLLVAARDGELQLLAAEDGKVLSRIRIADPRLPFPSSLELAVAGGTLVAASPARLFALEPRDASWAALGGAAGGRLFEKARLLRAEGRHEEALAAWKEIRRRGFPEHLRAEVEGGVVAAAEAAARAAKDPAFVREVLADASLVQDRRGKLSLRLLVASLLEARSPAEAAAAYRELAAEEEILVPAGNGFEVDVALHAANRLLALGSAGGEPVEAAAIAAILEDPAPAGASRAARRELANQAVRRPHLREASVALARLARAAELEGDLDQAAELLDSLLADRPELAADPLLAGKARQLAAARGREPVSPGLDAVLVPKDLPLQRRFWLASDEGFLAETPAASEPLPLLAVLAEGHLRLHDADGKLLHERPLPEFPDVSAVKLQFDASFEEPAVVRLDGNGLLLFTAAGLYSYRGRALAEGEGQGGVGRRADLKLAWASTWPHPLAGMPATGRWGRSGASRGAGNTFAEIVFARDGRPLILGRDGVLSAIDGRTGKLGFQLRPPGGGIPNSPPVLDGGRVLACFTNPAGIVAYRVPAASGRAGGTDGEGASSPLFIPSPADGFRQGGVAAGGLIAVYAGNGIEAVETATGRILWRRKDNAASLVHARALEVWLSLPDGALAIHSARSGELAATVPLPAGAGVIDVLEEPHAPQAAPGIAAAGEEARPAPTLLVLTRAAGRSRGMGEGAGGRGLHVVALGPRRETLFSVEVEKGLVTYGGARFTAGGGRCLFYNTEREPGKWSTRGALITPAGVVQEVFAAELTGKGTGQAPRLAVLRGGLGVGNADGFGWFGPQAGGAPPGGAGGLGAPPEGGEKR
jgi:outer membrane protein assembly factor BamB